MKRSLTPFIKLLVLVGIGLGLYRLWHSGSLRPDADDDDEPTASKTEADVGVHVGTITTSTLHQYVTVYGTVEPQPAITGKPAATARIMPPFPGLIAEVHVIEGQHVEKGQLLLTLDGRVVEAALKQARQVLTAAQENYERHKQSTEPDKDPMRQLLRSQNDRDLAQANLDNALAQRELLKITAPLSGTIVTLTAKPGEAADAATVLAELVDLDRLVVAANIPGSQLPTLKLNQSVRIDGASVATGQVSFIDERVDSKTDMGTVDVSIPPAAGLRLGQFVRIHIITEERRDCLTVPAESIVKDADGKATISVVDKEWAVPQPVQLGLREDDRVEVLGTDLKPGLTIVTTGAYVLSGKTKIHVLDQ